MRVVDYRRTLIEKTALCVQDCTLTFILIQNCTLSYSIVFLYFQIFIWYYYIAIIVTFRRSDPLGFRIQKDRSLSRMEFTVIKIFSCIAKYAHLRIVEYNQDTQQQRYCIYYNINLHSHSLLLHDYSNLKREGLSREILNSI